MVGAAILAGRAALHLGAGKVWVGLRSERRRLRSTGYNPNYMLVRAANALLVDSRTLWSSVPVSASMRARRGLLADRALTRRHW